MLLLNFGHPLTESQRTALAGLLRQPAEAVTVKDLPCQFDHEQAFVEQVRGLLDRVGLTETEWQTAELLINLPSLSAIAAALLAEVHGRVGYFPPVLRLRPVAGSVPPRFEVAEIINLQAVRDQARQRRSGASG